MKNIDDIFRDLLDEYALLKKEPERAKHVEGLTKVAATAAKIAEIKFKVSIARGQEPNDPMFGDFDGVPLGTKPAQALRMSAAEIEYRKFREELEDGKTPQK